MSADPFDKYQASRQYFMEGENEEQSMARIDGRLAELVPGKPQRRYLRLWLAGAAAVVLLFIGQRVLMQPDYPGMANDFFESYPSYQLNDARGDGAEGDRDQAFLAYENGAFTEAVNIFRSLEERTAVESLYLAISLQANDEWLESRQVLTDMPAGLPVEYQGAATWYLALAELSMENLESTITLLEEVAEGNSGFKDDAQELLRALR